jgi:uncharacterized protein
VTPELEPFALVLLRRPPSAPGVSDAETKELQAAHLAFLQTLRDRGVLAASGPFDDQSDESWRGLCLLRTSPEEARVLFDGDPLVRRGRIVVDVLTWFVRKGDIASDRE